MIKKMMILITTILLVGTVPAFAEVPSQTIIIGNKAFDIQLLSNSAYNKDIQQALNAVPQGTNQFYVKINQMPQWRTLFENTVLTQEQIGQWPEITYINSAGESIVYGAGNGGETSNAYFSVVDIY